MINSKTFEQKFNDSFLLIREAGFLINNDLPGIRQHNGSTTLDFFNQKIVLSDLGVNAIGSESLTVALKYLFCQYLQKCTDKACESSNRLVTIREFSDSGPLYSSFTSNTGKILETTFSGSIDRLKHRCLSLGGIIMENPSYDLSVRFKALSRIPVILNFNDVDELMPASAVFLFHDNADSYLDLECLTIICTWLTGQLIG